MEEPPPLDEDELINDYIEDGPPPPNEFDEDDEFVQLMTEHTNQNSPMIPTAAGLSLNSPTAITTPEDSPHSPLQLQSSSSARKRPKKDLFAFERYTDNKSWRSTSATASDDTLPITKKARSILVTPRSKKPSEGCLLHGLPNRTKLSSTRLSKTPSAMARTITLADQSRRYVKVHTAAASLLTESSSSYLLGVPFQTVLQNVHECRRQRLLHRVDDESEQQASHTNNTTTKLWVDKHAPSNFTHLLSDERTNRNVLKALKAWDAYIFGTNKKRPPPDQRVLLLSGPPGSGKSTLAKIVALHCRYQIIEVNGSDERSEVTLKDRVLSAMTSNTLSFDGKQKSSMSKPNLLILDEIDGADAAPSIKALVDIIQSDRLKRPIIFICNNKYAPALKPLLGIAVPFHLFPPSNERLLLRLRSVLKAEKQTVPTNLLNQLIGVATGDIRSCLHTLQFASSTNNNSDMSKALQNLLNGSTKDERNDLVNTVAAVFRKPKALRFGGIESSAGTVMDLVQSFGDFSRIMDCLFLNVLKVPYIDPMLDRCTAAHEWISSSDLYRGAHVAAAIHLLCRVENRQELTFSSRPLADLQYIRENHRGLVQKFADGVSLHARGAQSECATLTIPYLTWALSAGSGSGALDRSVAALELLNDGEKRAFESHSAILRTMGLRYVVDEEFGRKEASHLPQAVRLDPPIERLIVFEELVPDRKDIPIALKQMLSRRASHDRLRHSNAPTFKPKAQEINKNAAMISSTLNTGSTTKIVESGRPLKRTEPTGAGNKQRSKKRPKKTENFLLLGARKAKAARTSRTAARVGLQPASHHSTKQSKTGSGVPLSQVVRLKYVKGFTQAVRTPCKLDDL